jgi:hypothetical protein
MQQQQHCARVTKLDRYTVRQNLSLPAAANERLALIAQTAGTYCNSNT